MRLHLGLTLRLLYRPLHPELRLKEQSLERLCDASVMISKLYSLRF